MGTRTPFDVSDDAVKAYIAEHAASAGGGDADVAAYLRENGAGPTIRKKKTPQDIQDEIQRGMFPMPRPSLGGEVLNSAREVVGGAARGVASTARQTVEHPGASLREAIREIPGGDRLVPGYMEQADREAAPGARNAWMAIPIGIAGALGGPGGASLAAQGLGTGLSLGHGRSWEDAAQDGASAALPVIAGAAPGGALKLTGRAGKWAADTIRNREVQPSRNIRQIEAADGTVRLPGFGFGKPKGSLAEGIPKGDQAPEILADQAAMNQLRNEIPAARQYLESQSGNGGDAVPDYGPIFPDQRAPGAPGGTVATQAPPRSGTAATKPSPGATGTMRDGTAATKPSPSAFGRLRTEPEVATLADQPSLVGRSQTTPPMREAPPVQAGLQEHGPTDLLYPNVRGNLVTRSQVLSGSDAPAVGRGSTPALERAAAETLLRYGRKGEIPVTRQLDEVAAQDLPPGSSTLRADIDRLAAAQAMRELSVRGAGTITGTLRQNLGLALPRAVYPLAKAAAGLPESGVARGLAATTEIPSGIASTAVTSQAEAAEKRRRREVRRGNSGSNR